MNKRQITIEIVRILLEDPSKRVMCPACTDAILEVKDIINELDSNVVERQVYCPTCDFEIYIRINKSELTNDVINRAPADNSTEAQDVFRFIDKAIKELKNPEQNSNSLRGRYKEKE